eukprot:4129792-Karenia_brevis.AAC.1
MLSCPIDIRVFKRLPLLTVACNYEPARPLHMVRKLGDIKIKNCFFELQTHGARSYQGYCDVAPYFSQQNSRPGTSTEISHRRPGILPGGQNIATACEELGALCCQACDYAAYA